jgi:hypothetical protein
MPTTFRRPARWSSWCRQPPPAAPSRRVADRVKQVPAGADREIKPAFQIKDDFARPTLPDDPEIPRCQTIREDLSNTLRTPWRRPELVEQDRQARELYAQGLKVPEIVERADGLPISVIGSPPVCRV